jgi:hypothetical protein
MTGFITGIDGGAHLEDPPHREDRNGVILYGQSLTTGLKAYPLLNASPVTGLLNLTFGSGPKSTRAGHIGTNDTPGVSTTKLLCEDHLSNDGPANEGETMCTTLASVASDLSGLAASAFVIFASCAGHSGYTIVELEKGADWYDNFINHVKGGFNRGADASETYVLQAVCWVQGSSDSRDEDVTREDYLDHLLQLVDDINADTVAITSQDTPVYLLLAQIAQVKERSTPAVALAQLDAVEQSPLIQLVTSVAPFQTAEASPDGLHWTAAGQVHAGHYFGRAFNQLVNLHRVPDAIMPLTFKANGVNLHVRFRTPTELQFTSEWAATPDRGFRVFDDVGDVTIVDVSASGDMITIVMDRALGAGATVSYGLDALSADINLADAAFGDVCDSVTDTVVIDGVTKHLWHHAPAFQKAITLV